MARKVISEMRCTLTGQTGWLADDGEIYRTESGARGEVYVYGFGTLPTDSPAVDCIHRHTYRDHRGWARRPA